MTNIIKGIHHITAIASDPQRTVDFYTQTLGLRLVKKSVNQDDVATYHLFFGDRTGEPGMDLTFFTFQPSMPGKRGTGLVTTISLAVAKQELTFWLDRFSTLGIKHEGISERLGFSRLVFYDPDDQKLELVGVEASELREASGDIWTTSEIAETQAIRYFFSATLSVKDIQLVEPILLHIFGYESVVEYQGLSLYKVPTQVRAAYLEVEELPEAEPGFGATGTVHHIAFSVSHEADQKQLRQELLQVGLYPTEVIDRYYFKSVYFKIPAGILFELATMGPGFTADESEEELGKKLALPPFLEPQRELIEAGLQPISLAKVSESKGQR